MSEQLSLSQTVYNETKDNLNASGRAFAEKVN